MTDRMDLGGGGLTGATGDLVPEDTDREFDPGERRETSGVTGQGAVTFHQAAHAPAQQGEIGEPGEDRPEGGPTNMATRESGYGSEQGLSPNDPAYRMEIHPPVVEKDRPAGGIRIGGDEITDREERF